MTDARCILDLEILSDLKFNFLNFKLTLRIVHNDISIGDLVGVEYVLAELDLEARLSLIEAATRSEGDYLFALGILDKLNRFLVDNKPLLIFENLLLLGLENSLNRILDLHKGLFLAILLLIKHRCWEVGGWQSELKWNHIITWS
jgi:hypothetical protein